MNNPIRYTRGDGAAVETTRTPGTFTTRILTPDGMALGEPAVAYEWLGACRNHSNAILRLGTMVPQVDRWTRIKQGPQTRVEPLPTDAAVNKAEGMLWRVRVLGVGMVPIEVHCRAKTARRADQYALTWTRCRWLNRKTPQGIEDTRRIHVGARTVHNDPTQ